MAWLTGWQVIWYDIDIAVSSASTSRCGCAMIYCWVNWILFRCWWITESENEKNQKIKRIRKWKESENEKNQKMKRIRKWKESENEKNQKMKRIRKWKESENEKNQKMKRIRKWNESENETNQKMKRIRKWKESENEIKLFPIYSMTLHICICVMSC